MLQVQIIGPIRADTSEEEANGRKFFSFQPTSLQNELNQFRYDVLASLYWIPCTQEELAKRDFCLRFPAWFINIILLKLESQGLVVKRKDGVYKAIKGKAKKVLNQLGYEIDD